MSSPFFTSSRIIDHQLPERFRTIGSVEQHRCIVSNEMRQPTHYQGIALQGPEYAIVAPDMQVIDNRVRHLFIDMTSKHSVSRPLYEYLRTLLTGQGGEPGNVYCYTFERTASYNSGDQRLYTVLTVYPLCIVQLGDGTYFIERKPVLQTDEAYMIFDRYSSHPHTAPMPY